MQNIISGGTTSQFAQAIFDGMALFLELPCHALTWKGYWQSKAAMSYIASVNLICSLHLKKKDDNA